MIEDNYATLGLDRDATADDIKRAYRRLVRILHSDVNSDPRAHARFREVVRAYETLKAAGDSRDYDESSSFGSASDLEKFTSHDDVPLPPRLSRSAVDFGGIQQGDNSISQAVVVVSNPNDDGSLRPVFKPKKSTFWRTRQIDSDLYQFTVSTYRSEFLEPGTYTSKIKIYWDGFPEVVTELPVSLVVKPRPSSPAATTGTRPQGPPAARKPQGTTPRGSRPSATESRVGAGVGWAIFALVNLVGPILVMYWTVGGVTTTVSGGGTYVIVGPICLVWLLFGFTNCVKMAIKSFKGQ